MSAPGLALCALVMAIGLVGTIVPLVPGLSLVWLTALVYGLVAGFGASGVIAFAFITLLFAGSAIAKIVLPHRRGRAGGAPLRSLVSGAAGGLIGFFAIPVVGMPVGALLGVLLAERVRTNEWEVAWRSTKGVLVGMGIAVALELLAGVLMVLAWVSWVLL